MRNLISKKFNIQITNDSHNNMKPKIVEIQPIDTKIQIEAQAHQIQPGMVFRVQNPSLAQNRHKTLNKLHKPYQNPEPSQTISLSTDFLW
jgi:hypothetical protein